MRTGLLLAAAMFSVLLVQPSAMSQTPVALSVDGPTAIAPAQIGVFFVNVSGGPAESGGSFVIKYWVDGSDIAGASPLAGSPGELSGENRTYKLNVTAPSKETSFDVVIEATSKNDTANTTVRKTIAVQSLAPLILTASFLNSGGAAVLNTTVRFFVDNTLAGTRVIARIDPGEKGTATLTWIPQGLGPGQHTIRMEADINGDGVIDASKGEVIAFDSFYKTGGELAPGYVIIIAGFIIVVGLLVIVTYRRRKKTR